MEDLILKFTLDDPKPEPDNCKGLYFRGYNNFYSQGINVHRKQGVKFLKRKSCPGCKYCSWYYDQMNEMLQSDCVLLPEIEHGALYSIRVINESRDWETGYIDQYDFEFYEVEEN